MMGSCVSWLSSCMFVDPRRMLDEKYAESEERASTMRRSMAYEYERMLEHGKAGRIPQAVFHLDNYKHMQRMERMHYFTARRIAGIRRNNELHESMRQTSTVNDELRTLVNRMGLRDADKSVKAYEKAMDRCREAVEDMKTEDVEDAVDVELTTEEREVRYESAQDELFAIMAKESGLDDVRVPDSLASAPARPPPAEEKEDEPEERNLMALLMEGSAV